MTTLEYSTVEFVQHLPSTDAVCEMSPCTVSLVIPFNIEDINVYHSLWLDSHGWGMITIDL